MITKDLARAAAFYDALLGEIGGKRMLGVQPPLRFCSSQGETYGMVSTL